MNFVYRLNLQAESNDLAPSRNIATLVPNCLESDTSWNVPLLNCPIDRIEDLYTFGELRTVSKTSKNCNLSIAERCDERVFVINQVGAI